MKRFKSTKKTTAKLETPSVIPAPQVAPAAATPKPVPTTIEATIDVGFGNHLFVRGQGAGLSWERGTPLTCVGPDRWRWSAHIADSLTFKLLLNDATWSHGENIVAKPGARVELAPRF